jgi:hypothetical protein
MNWRFWLGSAGWSEPDWRLPAAFGRLPNALSVIYHAGVTELFAASCCELRASSPCSPELSPNRT